MTKISGEWPRIASGQPGSIASRIFGRVHKASRRHYHGHGEDHSPRLKYERSKHRSIDTDHEELDGRRKKSKRWEYESSRNSQSPLTNRTFSGHHDSNRDKSHSPSHFEHHNHNSHRSQASEDSVTSNKYFAFHPSASP